MMLSADIALAEPLATATTAEAASEQPGQVPSFLDASSMTRLQSALFATGAGNLDRADTAHSEQTEPQPVGAPAFGSGLSHFLPEVLRSGRMATASALTTADFSSTLFRARRDTGEVRALVEEVRRRAEEISQRFVAGSWQQTPVTAGAASVSVATGGPFVAGPDTPAAAAAVEIAAPAQTTDTRSGAVTEATAPSAPTLAASEGRAPDSAAPRPAASPPEGRMALGVTGGDTGEEAALPAVVGAADDRFRGAAIEPAAGIDIVTTAAPRAAPAPARAAVGGGAAKSGKPIAKRLPGMARPEQHLAANRRAIATAKLTPPPAKSKRGTPVQASAASVAAAVSAKPPIVKSSAEVAAAVAASAAAQATPKPAATGLFSSVKPFAVPRSLEALGWDSEN